MASALMDSLFGTRYHTEGATIQRPRKVPMRVEPKSYFGESDFLHVSGRSKLALGTCGRSPPHPPPRTPNTHPTPNQTTTTPNQPANERTFLSWCSMATTMGGVSSALVGLTITQGAGSGGSGAGSGGRVISARTVDMITAIYVPVAVIMVLYALFQYENRSRFMQRKQVGFFDDRVGPVALAGIVLLTLVLISVIAFVDVLT
jgi:uncharacterized membrane protein YidH (DUF202 family)